MNQDKNQLPSTPEHLKGAAQIAGVFGVSRRTVLAWHLKGAPIALIGKKYQTNYSELWSWLKHKDKGECATNPPASPAQLRTDRKLTED